MTILSSISIFKNPFHILLNINQKIEKEKTKKKSNNNLYLISMKRRQIILSFLFSILLFTSIKSQPDLQSVTIDLTSQDLLKAPTAHRKQYQAKIFVDVDDQHFYEYLIVTQNGELNLKILSQDDDFVKLCFKTQNIIRFVDAYRNLILVKQVDSSENILSYYVLQILYDTNKDVFTLDSFAINAHVDDQFYNFGNGQVVGKKTYYYQLTKILEYNQQEGWISVINSNGVDMTVYKINVAQKLNVLIAVGWFYFKGQTITGGNTYVLYDQANNQIMIDQQICRPTSDTQAVYKKVSMKSLTTLPIYNKNRVYNMAGSYFQYVSQNKQCKQMTSFLYNGYGDQPIQGQINIKSKTAIKYFFDNYNFFVAITDCDIYLSNVYYDEVSSGFKVFTNTLRNTIKKSEKAAQVYRDWSCAIKIVFIEDKFYILTPSKFLVYGTGNKYFQKLYEADCVAKVSQQNRASEILFAQIMKYERKISGIKGKY